MTFDEAKPGDYVEHLHRKALGFILKTHPVLGCYLLASEGRSGWCKPEDLHPKSILYRKKLELATYEAFAKSHLTNPPE